MLYEAGRASAGLEMRQRFLIAASALLLVAFVGSSSLLVRERARRFALEGELAARSLQRTPTLPRGESLASEPLPSVEISPYSYLTLSRSIQPGGLDEWVPAVKGAQPGSSGEPSRLIAPVHVRGNRMDLDL